MSIAPGSYVTSSTRTTAATRNSPPAGTVFTTTLTPWGDPSAVTLLRSSDTLAAATLPDIDLESPTVVRELAVAAFATVGIPITTADVAQGEAFVAALFAEGVDRVYVRRFVGPAAAAAGIVLVDADDDPALAIGAKYPGELGNLISVAVAAGTTSGIKITVTAPPPLLTAPVVLDNLVSNPAAATAINAHAELKPLIVAIAGEADGLAEPAAEAPLEDGTSDIVGAATATASELTDRYRFPAELGPGVIVDVDPSASDFLTETPAETPADYVAAMGAMLIETRRILVLGNTAGGATEADSLTNLSNYGNGIVAMRTALADAVGADHAAELLGTIGVVFGEVAVADPIDAAATVYVNLSALAAGARARAITDTGPHQAPAGIHGISLIGATPILDNRYPTGVATDTIHSSIHSVGGNTVRRIAGTTRLYGWRSIAPDGSDWAALTARDTVNAIAGNADARSEELPFSFIDGKGHAFARLEGILTGIAEEYAAIGALYPGVDPETGDELDPGYIVDTGDSVNTAETIAAGYIIGVLGVRPSPTASIVIINVRKAAIGGPI